MKYIDTKSTDIYYNLALEEYIFEHYRKGSYLLLWQNDTSIVVGKYQNTYEEINLKAVEQQNINVARRNTGGGTVFHDIGNLNYSYITDYDQTKFLDYDVFIGPMIKALEQLGIPAVKRNRSDIVVEGKKISGNAQTIKNGRILSHGTLLFDANLSRLHQLLRPSDGIIESKAVKSVRSEVVNIKSYLSDQNMTTADLIQYFRVTLFPEQPVEPLILSKEEQKEIQHLASEKYSSWQWNYAFSPNFTFRKQSMIQDKHIDVRLLVIKGKIFECDLKYGRSTEDQMKELLIHEKLRGTRYSYREVKNIIQTVVGHKDSAPLADCFFRRENWKR